MHSLQTISRLSAQEYEAHKAAVVRAQAQAARDEAAVALARSQGYGAATLLPSERNAAVLKHAEHA